VTSMALYNANSVGKVKFAAMYGFCRSLICLDGFFFSVKVPKVNSDRRAIFCRSAALMKRDSAHTAFLFSCVHHLLCRSGLSEIAKPVVCRGSVYVVNGPSWPDPRHNSIRRPMSAVMLTVNCPKKVPTTIRVDERGFSGVFVVPRFCDRFRAVSSRPEMRRGPMFPSKLSRRWVVFNAFAQKGDVDHEDFLRSKTTGIMHNCSLCASWLRERGKPDGNM
jgi:hypothetical protein